MNTILFLLYNLTVALCFGALGYFFARSKAEWNNPKKRWSNHKIGNEVHVIPDNDKHIHRMTDECGCSPQNIPVAQTDGTLGWRVIHNALDGRSFS